MSPSPSTPAPASPGTPEQHGQYYVLRCSQDDAPMALILGWLNSELRYVLKYARMYNDLGYDAIIALSKPSHFFRLNPSQQLQPLVTLLHKANVLAPRTSPPASNHPTAQPTNHFSTPPQPSSPPPHIPMAPSPSSQARLHPTATPGTPSWDSLPLPSPSPSSAMPSTSSSSPVVVHVFSNGGVLMLHALLAVLDTEGVRLNMRAVVADSAPSTRSDIRIGMVAFTVGLPPVVRQLSMALFVVTALVDWCFRRLFRVPLWVDKAQEPLLRSEYKDVPKLFIYSKADLLVSFKEVEEYVTRSLQLGHPTQTLRLERSAHVKHYVEHPREYLEAVKQLLMTTS